MLLFSLEIGVETEQSVVEEVEVVEVLNIDFVWLPRKASLYLKS